MMCAITPSAALTDSPLPDAVARRRMFELNIGATPCSLTSDDLRELAEATEGYSGSDLSVRRPGCTRPDSRRCSFGTVLQPRAECTADRSAIMAPIRKFMEATHFKPVRRILLRYRLTAQVQVPVPDSNPPRYERKLQPCSPGDAGAEERAWTVRSIFVTASDATRTSRAVRRGPVKCADAGSRATRAGPRQSRLHQSYPRRATIRVGCRRAKAGRMGARGGCVGVRARVADAQAPSDLVRSCTIVLSAHRLRLCCPSGHPAVKARCLCRVLRSGRRRLGRARAWRCLRSWSASV